MKAEILKKIQDRTIVAGVIGLGYVGLPLAVEKAKALDCHRGAKKTNII